MKRLCIKIFVVIAYLTLVAGAHGQSDDSDSEYLSWNAKQAEQIGKKYRQKGSVGSLLTLRGFNTDRAINYDLRVTLLTPELIRASARLAQLRNRLTDEKTKDLVREAEDAGDLIVLVEIDPNEGSGVIPLDWRVFLQPKGLQADAEGAIAGIKSPSLRQIEALKGVFRRDYDFDLFYVSFPLVDENKKPLLSPEVAEIEVLVGIYKSEGSVSWRMPDSIRERIRSLSLKNTKEEVK